MALKPALHPTLMESGAFLVITVAFLAGALLIALGERFFSDSIPAAELWAIYRAEAAVVGTLVLPAFLGPGALLAMLVVLCARCQHELGQEILPGLPRAHRVLGFIGAMALPVLVFQEGEIGLLHGLVLFTFCVLVADLTTAIEAPRVDQLGKLIFTVIYPSMFLSYLLLLRMLPEGFLLMIFVFLVVETEDAFALIIGKTLGKILRSSRVFPQLSPGKTWVGLIGGILAGISFGCLLGSVVAGLPWVFSLTGAVLVALSTPVGDLVASKLKRNLSLKDFGRNATRLGGILDVYDSLIFCAPLFYYYCRCWSP